MEMKSKLCLQIILRINYLMEENLFVYVKWSPAKHAALWSSIRKNVTEKQEKKKEKKKERE